MYLFVNNFFQKIIKNYFNPLLIHYKSILYGYKHCRRHDKSSCSSCFPQYHTHIPDNSTSFHRPPISYTKTSESAFPSYHTHMCVFEPPPRLHYKFRRSDFRLHRIHTHIQVLPDHTNDIHILSGFPLHHTHIPLSLIHI